MSQKLKQNFYSKKGYIQIDFAFALLIFTVFIIFIFNYYSSYMNQHEKMIIQNKMEITAEDLCNLLVNSQGVPRNWESNLSTLKILGLKNKSTYSLNPSKVSRLLSGNYLNITKNLNDEFIYGIKIVGVNTNTTYGNFGYDIDNSKLSSEYTCYSNYNNEIVKIIVHVEK